MCSYTWSGVTKIRGREAKAVTGEGPGETKKFHKERETSEDG